MASPKTPVRTSSAANAGKDRSSELVLDGVRRRLPLKLALLSFGAWLTLVGVTAAVFGVAGVYFIFAPGLPDIPKVGEYRPPIVSEVYSDDAVLAGEFYNERR